MNSRLFGDTKPVIGMIHVGALPGTPRYHASLSRIVAQAVREARIYRECGVDGIAIENMHDLPYLRGGVGPEIVSSMTVVAHAVRAEFKGPIGIQVLAAANREALAVAHATNLEFVRVEGFTFAHVADEGIIQSCAADLLRYRKQIGAEKVQVWADIKKKHASHAITADVSLEDTAHAAEFMGADALIITGTATGRPPRIADVKAASHAAKLPIILGSGIDARNVKSFMPAADGFIIGSFFKKDGYWENDVDASRVDSFLSQARKRSK